MDGVQDAVVVGREDSLGEQRLIAYFVPSKWPALTTSQIRKVLAGALPDYMIPSVFVCLEQLPQTPNGKTDRLRLPAPSHRRPALDAEYAAPRNFLEQELARIWSEVLAIDAIGVRDDFFELGGDSLLATKVAVRALKELKIEVPLKLLFRAPTIAGLTAEFGQGAAGKPSDTELGTLLDRIESLSDEEVRQWLEQH